MITTPFSFIASANCLLYEGVTPRFVDIEEETLGINPELIPSAGSDQTRAVLAVNVFGAPCHLDAIEALTAERGWYLVEDSCESLGSRIGERPCGSFGVASVFAFYPNKQITTGEGGMVVTDNVELATRVRSLRNQGRDEDGTWLRHIQLGYNYRMDEMSAALGVGQLERYAELRTGRSRAANAYERVLANISWLSRPLHPSGSDVDWFVYVVRVADGVDRDALIESLGRRGVPARPYFSPIHLQPFYRDQFGFTAGDFPITERVARSTLAIPFSSRHTEDEIERVADALRTAGKEQGFDG